MYDPSFGCSRERATACHPVDDDYRGQEREQRDYDKILDAVAACHRLGLTARHCLMPMKRVNVRTNVSSSAASSNSSGAYVSMTRGAICPSETQLSHGSSFKCAGVVGVCVCFDDMMFLLSSYVARACQRHEKTHHANMVGLRRAFVVRVLDALEERCECGFLGVREYASARDKLACG